MKYVFLLLILVFCFNIKAQNKDSVNLNSLTYKNLFSKPQLETIHSIIIMNPNNKRLIFNFEGDTLKCSGDLPLDSAADLFITFLIEKYSFRIDSLKSEIKRLKLNNKNE